MSIPHEFSIGGVYMPPILIAAFFGVIATSITTKLLNKYNLSKYFFYPPLVSIALLVIFTILFGVFVIPF
jgi:hypothetical protein